MRSLGYVTRSFFLDSACFALPQSRRRLYVAAVSMRRAKLVESPDEWLPKLQASKRKIAQHSTPLSRIWHCSCLAKEQNNSSPLPLQIYFSDSPSSNPFSLNLFLCYQPCPPSYSNFQTSKPVVTQAISNELLQLQRDNGVKLFDVLYPNDHPKVKAYLKECLEKKRDDVRQKLVTGEGWTACFARVQLVREHLQKEFKCEVRPGISFEPTCPACDFHYCVERTRATGYSEHRARVDMS